ncbi:uncharacterized protein LOC128253188 [Drosophila gunungcola]|uniref:Uncharacterized protein n=1 Tax=Drosophila gunungcola TaxID=103775 RepID=A0A9Q0BN17_9MUSC|nr:uncharacterized protein LOC128253188 [Drosophila gunungcola]KAI8038257.1 hypothetical protein M5D96_008946 [Drosophila gunungcola]
MDGFYNNNGCGFNNSGYSQCPKRGSCCNCPGGNCPRMEAGGNDSHGTSQQGCPGGTCCPGGRCPAGKSRFNPYMRNGGC